MKLKLLLIALVFSTFYLPATPVFKPLNGITEMTGNTLPTGIDDSNDVKKETANISRRDTNNTDENDTAERPWHKKDKRGVLSFTMGWQNRDAYLGSYYIDNFNYGYAELRYKFWFGLFGAIAPQFLFNRDSFYYVGSNLTVGFDNEWFRNFHVSFSYSYCARQESSVEALQNLWGNDFDVYVYYANKIIVPEVRYDLTFGPVSGIALSNVTSPGRINVLGHDNVINVGLSHNFILFHDKPGGDLSIKLGDNANFGTANALLTNRVTQSADNSAGYQYVDVPYTSDNFGPLNDEVSLAIDYTWRFITLYPYINLSIPFKNIAAEQASIDAAAGQTAPPDIVTKTFFYGGASLILKYPAKVVRRKE